MPIMYSEKLLSLFCGFVFPIWQLVNAYAMSYLILPIPYFHFKKSSCMNRQGMLI